MGKINSIFFSQISAFIGLFLVCSIEAFSQNYFSDYKPVRDFRAGPELIKDYKLKFNSWTSKAVLTNKDAKNQFAESIKRKVDFLFSLDSANLLMYNDTFTHFLNTIRDNIISKNSSLAEKNIVFFTYRSEEPNAYNLGEGVVLMSTGLLTRLRTVDEIAFVMCHEIGHDELKHVFRGIERECNAFCDPSFRKKIKQTAKQTYGRNAEYERLLTAHISNYMNHSRVNELEADSLGYVFFTNAGYHPKAATDVMNILDSADYIRYPDTLDLRHFFNFTDYPFKNYWMEQDRSKPLWERDSLLFMIPDSLKTHPDCKVRIRQFAKHKLNEKVEVSEKILEQRKRFEQIKGLFPFEGLEVLMQSNDYATSLYVSLHMQKMYPENIYLKCVTAHCLYELADALKNNEYSHYVDFPDKKYSNGYNQMLTFLQNMNSSTLRNLFSFYFNQHLNHAKSNTYIGFLNVLLANLNNQNKDITSDVKKYELEYNDSYLAALLKAKNKPADTKNKKK